VASNDSIVEGVAGRYAAALFDLAKEASHVPEVEAHLRTFQALLDESQDLLRMVRSPVIATEDQAKAMDAILAKVGITGLAANFFKLITANRRLFAVTDIIKAFHAIAAKDRGEVAAEVSSAFALNDQQTADLKAALQAAVGKDVTLNMRVDANLLGGLVVKVGSRMIDSSLRTKLHNLKAELSGAGA
jgi:F-type H+-transporting ATPase subunit delta